MKSLSLIMNEVSTSILESSDEKGKSFVIYEIDRDYADNLKYIYNMDEDEAIDHSVSHYRSIVALINAYNNDKLDKDNPLMIYWH